MKKINVFLQLLALLFVVGACEEQDNIEPIGNWELSSPALAGPADNAAIGLNVEDPNAIIRFDWQGAVSSKNYGVQYAFVLDSAANSDFRTPVLRVPSGNGGRDLFVELTNAQIDQALSALGYAANTEVDLKWTVIATSLSKQTIAPPKGLKVRRFVREVYPLQLFVSGTATEKGSDLSQAIAMRPLKDANGNNTNVFEVYTGLTSGGTLKFYSQQNAQAMVYGGVAGSQFEKDGDDITAPGAGQYRITVDFNTNTYTFLKIDKWSVVGDVIAGGWGGDEPLEYKGNGVWQGSINLVKDAGFVFRANGDWDYLLKRVKGTTNQVVMEKQAVPNSFEDIPSTGTGNHTFTLNLSGPQYTYSIVKE